MMKGEKLDLSGIEDTMQGDVKTKQKGSQKQGQDTMPTWNLLPLDAQECNHCWPGKMAVSELLATQA